MSCTIVLLLVLVLYGVGAPLKRTVNNSFWVARSQHMIFSVLATHKVLGSNHLQGKESPMRHNKRLKRQNKERYMYPKSNSERSMRKLCWKENNSST